MRFLEIAAAIWCGCTGLMALIYFCEALTAKLEKDKMSLTNYDDVIDKFFLPCVKEIKIWYPALEIAGSNLYSVERVREKHDGWVFVFSFPDPRFNRTLWCKLVCSESFDGRVLITMVENKKISN